MARLGVVAEAWTVVSILITAWLVAVEVTMTVTSHVSVFSLLLRVVLYPLMIMYCDVLAEEAEQVGRCRFNR